jgi:hypothetical protein
MRADRSERAENDESTRVAVGASVAAATVEFERSPRVVDGLSAQFAGLLSAVLPRLGLWPGSSALTTNGLLPRSQTS